jgi:hypothetical protein
MTFIVTPKNKKEERVLKAFLNSLQIGFHSEAEEDAALYRAMQEGRKSALLSKAEKSDFIKRLKKAK